MLDYPNVPLNPSTLDDPRADGRHVMIQDIVWSDANYLGTVSPWTANHGLGEARLIYGPTNPSGWLRTMNNRSNISGANMVFYAGHAQWTPEGKLVDVGRRKATDANARTWSVLP